MKTIGLTLSLVAALALPGTAFAHHGKGQHNGNKPAGKFCKELRTDLGAGPFQEAFGGKRNAFGKCVSTHARGLDRVRAFAKRQCKRQLGEDSTRRDLRRCVTKKVKQAAEAEHDQIVAAVADCRAARATDPEGFAAKYGTNHNKRNAFGKCVSSLARGGNNGGRGDDAGDGNGGEDGDGEGDDDQPDLDDAPGLDDDPPGLDGDPGLDDGQPDEGEGDV
jgi:hypothetical protein